MLMSYRSYRIFAVYNHTNTLCQSGSLINGVKQITKSKELRTKETAVRGKNMETCVNRMKEIRTPTRVKLSHFKIRFTLIRLYIIICK